ncbi:transcriptional regulator [Testudinibacter sp. P27/CKL/0425]
MAEKKLTATELKRKAMLASRLTYQKAKAEGTLKPV